MFLGAETMRPLIQRSVPDAEFMTRPRMSVLRYSGQKKVTRLPPRSAVVAFSGARVYALAELVRRQRGGAQATHHGCIDQIQNVLTCHSSNDRQSQRQDLTASFGGR